MWWAILYGFTGILFLEAVLAFKDPTQPQLENDLNRIGRFGYGATWGDTAGYFLSKLLIVMLWPPLMAIAMWKSRHGLIRRRKDIPAR